MIEGSVLCRSSSVSPSKGLRFEDTRFWVIHRRKEYGPFDYEWTPDLRGIELHYRGKKFGEICSIHEIFADMKSFGLPMRVVEVACVVLGSNLLGITSGYSSLERKALLQEILTEFKCDDFLTG